MDIFKVPSAGAVWARLALAGVVVTLAACSGGGAVDSAAAVPVVQPALADGTAVLPSSGGSVAVKSTSSPIAGAKVEFDTAALDGIERIAINYSDALPKPLSAESLALGAKAISRVLVLTRNGTADFGQAARVTIPYDKTLLSATAVPIVISWDETTQAYTPVTVRSLDRDAGSLSFMTAHFSKYVVVVLDKLFAASLPANAALTYTTGFAPAVDGFFDRNFGSYDGPGGNCFGMAGYAAWYHAFKKPVKGAGLFSLYREGDPVLEEDDQSVRELISRAYQAGSQKSHLDALNWAADLGLPTREAADRFAAYTVFQQLLVTQQSQILALGAGSAANWTDGHAVTVYAYDGTRKVFQLYDNEYPGETIELAWDPVAGFSSTTMKNRSWDHFAFASFNQAYSTTTLEALYQGAESGWASSNFPKIQVATPAEPATAKGLREVAAADNVSITGTVPRAPNATRPTAQRYLHVYLNGVKYGAAVAVANSNDAFTVNIQKLPSASGTDVMLLVSESPDSWRAAFSSFAQIRVKVADAYFFKNLGFESATFANWASERHFWGGSESVTPSDKSAVVDAGAFDSIATDLPLALFGRHAARINNPDNGLHISTLQQTAVVPQAGNPVVRFYWAAVLEDAQHTPAEQPYVEVSVTNTTRNRVLYSKRFYANDPAYTGWKSYPDSAWKSIAWQLVQLPVAAYVGDTLVLKVEAADCAQGAHGGYAYLDAEE